MPALKIRASGSEYIGVLMESVKTRYYFDYYPILEGKNILYISAFNVGEVTESLLGGDVINATAFLDGFLVLVNKGSELINRIPLIAMQKLRTHYPLIDKVIDWQKSYIEFSSTSAIVANESMVFAIYHEIPQKSILPDDINKNIELVDLRVNNVSQTRFYFREVLKLKDKKIRFIDFLAGRSSPNGFDAVSSTVYKKAYITLRNINGNDIISKMPVNELSYFISAGPNYIDWQDPTIDFDKSYIEMPSATGLALNTAFVFNFHYLDNVSPKGRKRREQTVS